MENKLKGTSDKKIHKILRISYDGLSDGEKDLVQDIACFFKGRKRDEVEILLDATGLKIGINRLAEKALISGTGNWINMHDLIEQMAKDIICEEKTPGKRRWLWDPEEIYFMLAREVGTEAVRGISLDMSKIKSINLSPTTFVKLYNLRYLFFYASECDNAQLCAPQGLEYLPELMKYLYWSQYPFKSLPVIRFWAEKLVELDMRDSQLEELWNGVQNLPNLKRIDLSGSKKLIKVADLSTASNLEFMKLYKCESLVELPSSMKYLTKLIELRLSYCSRLESLPDGICCLKSLSLLDVSYCENLDELPQNFGNLECLLKFKAESSDLKELPESFCNSQKFRVLEVGKCENLHRLPQKAGNLQSLEELLARTSGIKELPDSICNLKACTTLDVGKCINLHRLPQNSGNLECLQYLYAEGSGIEELPDSICNLEACTTIDVRKCVNLHRLTQHIGNLKHLQYRYADGSGIKEEPSFNNMSNLRELTFSGCKGLILPPVIGDFPHLSDIDLSNCNISEFPIVICSMTSLINLYLAGNNFEKIPESIQHLRKLEYLDLQDCKKLKYLPESIHNLLKLKTLLLSNCEKLLCLPESMEQVFVLRESDLRECTSLDQNRCSKFMGHLIMTNVVVCFWD